MRVSPRRAALPPTAAEATRRCGTAAPPPLTLQGRARAVAPPALRVSLLQSLKQAASCTKEGTWLSALVPRRNSGNDSLLWCIAAGCRRSHINMDDLSESPHRMLSGTQLRLRFPTRQPAHRAGGGLLVDSERCVQAFMGGSAAAAAALLPFLLVTVCHSLSCTGQQGCPFHHMTDRFSSELTRDRCRGGVYAGSADSEVCPQAGWWREGWAAKHRRRQIGCCSERSGTSEASLRALTWPGGQEGATELTAAFEGAAAALTAQEFGGGPAEAPADVGRTVLGGLAAGCGADGSRCGCCCNAGCGREREYAPTCSLCSNLRSGSSQRHHTTSTVALPRKLVRAYS